MNTFNKSTKWFRDEKRMKFGEHTDITLGNTVSREKVFFYIFHILKAVHNSLPKSRVHMPYIMVRNYESVCISNVM